MTSNLRVLPVGPVAAQRPLLVAVHGWLLSGRLWQPLIPALGPDWELWAPDLPGFGAQHRPRGLTPNLASYGRWLAGQCEARLTAGRQVVLVGHSLGGSVALHAAPLLGSRLAGVVQIAVGGGVYQPRPFRQVRRGGAAFVRWRPRWLADLPALAALRSPLVAEQRAALGLLACSMRRQAVQQLPRLTASLQAPSLWIAGERDTVMAPRYVRHLAGYAPGHGVTVLAGGGHLPMRQMPAELAAVMVPWLNELAPADQATCPQSAASPRSWSSASLA
jgi:pimeloyl-ACP methyl ester carboxylesterase